MQKTIEIAVNGVIKEVEVKEIPIVKYPQILKSVKELPKHLKGLDKKDNADLFEQIPFLISVATPDIISILVVALGDQLTKDEIENLGLKSFTDLVMTIVEVNNYPEIYQILKKALAQASQNRLGKVVTKPKIN